MQQRNFIKDPEYALAYIGLGHVSWLSATWGNIAPEEAYTKANLHLKKALEIDSTLAKEYSMLGTINTFYYYLAHLQLGRAYYMAKGMVKEGIAQ